MMRGKNKNPESARAMALRFLLLAMAILAVASFLVTGCEAGRPNIPRTGQSVVALGPDGIPDEFDNCPGLANPATQPVAPPAACVAAADCAGFGPSVGGIPVALACVGGGCAMQPDNELDGAGDACDDDDDNDGIADAADNCPLVANTLQVAHDGDGLGDACDDDDDGDGVLDGADNCPFAPNPLQEDTDLDGVGDACEADPDGDGI